MYKYTIDNFGIVFAHLVMFFIFGWFTAFLKHFLVDTKCTAKTVE